MMVHPHALWGTQLLLGCIWPATTAVHPHARGERPGVPVMSPIPERFIPTPVGNAGTRLSESPSPWRSTPTPVGTPPQGGSDAKARLIIPTPVGDALVSRPWASPENGSSPRPWGTRSRPCHPGRARTGSSPRPWGTRTPRTSTTARPSVHPHARGERAADVSKPSLAQSGSSPRPWGAPRTLREIGRMATPAHIATPVPRVIAMAALMARSHSGSSPRPWGTPQPACEAD